MANGGRMDWRRTRVSETVRTLVTVLWVNSTGGMNPGGDDGDREVDRLAVRGGEGQRRTSHPSESFRQPHVWG